MNNLKSPKGNGIKIQRLKLTTNDDSQFKFNSFFAGIGGFDLGFERAGISPAFHCEIDQFCNSVLKRHWPNLCSSNDINQVNADDLPEAEIWCGGFPCQDVSVARGGNGRDGLKGKNSGLFYPFFELVEKKLPKIVILENVTGLLNSHRGQDFKTILSSFCEIGYGVAWRVINARYFGVPQSRPRIFICAWKDRVDLALNVLYEKSAGSAIKKVRDDFLTPTKDIVSGATVPLLAYCLAATSGRHTGTDWSRTYIAYFDEVRRFTPAECEGLQGFPKDWSLPEEDYPLSDDEIDTLRYHALGNAVCVPVVRWIGNRIVLTLLKEREKIKHTIVHNASSFIQNANNHEDFSGLSIADVNNLICDSENKNSHIKWKSGGIAKENWYIEEKVSPSPSQPIVTNLLNIIEKTNVDSKYFLSPNAATGILRRVQNQGRTLFKPLYEALVRLSQKEIAKIPYKEFHSQILNA